MFQIGTLILVILVPTSLVIYILTTGYKRSTPSNSQTVHIASPNIFIKEGENDPKVVLSIFSDFLCPACSYLEQSFGSTIDNLIDRGTIAVNYHMLTILDKLKNNYSSRSSNASYCIADSSIDSFRKFYSMLYETGVCPKENSGIYPNNAYIITMAQQINSNMSIENNKIYNCINKGHYLEIVSNMAKITKIDATPTIIINNKDYTLTTPEALIDKVNIIISKP